MTSRMCSDTLHSQVTCGMCSDTLHSQVTCGMCSDTLHSQVTCGMCSDTLHSQVTCGMCSDTLHSQVTCGMCSDTLHSQVASAANIQDLQSASRIGSEQRVRILGSSARNRVQITCNTSSALSHASVMLHDTWYEGTAQLLSLTESKSHLFELYFIG